MLKVKIRQAGWILSTCVAITLLVNHTVFAGEDSTKAVAEEAVVSDSNWSYLNLWDYTTLYSNKEDSFIQEVKIIGRYHGQYYYDSSNHGHSAGWENRRFRPGFAVKFWNKFKFQGEINLADVRNLDGPFFKSWDNLYLQWEPTKKLRFKFGRQKSDTTQERYTSSKYIITAERSLLVNQLTSDKILGASARYKFTDKLSLQSGIYSSPLDNKLNSYKGSGGVAALMKLGYKVNENTQAYLDYWYADRQGGAREIKDYKHVFSLNTTNIWDDFGLNTDLIYGVGTGLREGEEVFGLTLMPWYNITDKLQGVFRYQLGNSNSVNGISLAKRYDRLAVTDGGGTRGDLYNAIYLGLNYKINGDKLKLMAGAEYSHLTGGKDDFSGVTPWVGVRTFW
ncbi:MAG: porin [Verrucomicrobiota bacterium]